MRFSERVQICFKSLTAVHGFKKVFSEDSQVFLQWNPKSEHFLHLTGFNGACSIDKLTNFSERISIKNSLHSGRTLNNWQVLHRKQFFVSLSYKRMARELNLLLLKISRAKSSLVNNKFLAYNVVCRLWSRTFRSSVEHKPATLWLMLFIHFFGGPVYDETFPLESRRSLSGEFVQQ